MTAFEIYCADKRRQYGAEFVPPTGEHLIRAFNLGDNYRVKVRTTYPGGEVRERWGYVGVTTGWRPAFLLMKRRGQHGSSDLLSPTDQFIDSHWVK